MEASANRVLLIHESYKVALTRAALLQRKGYSVHLADGREEAKRLLTDFHFGLVIVDSEQNHRDAIELCEELKKDSPGINVAIVAWYNTPVRSTCPDEVIRREDGPQGVVAAVQSLLPPASASPAS